jgi:hypothetical protein
MDSGGAFAEEEDLWELRELGSLRTWPGHMQHLLNCIWRTYIG